MGRRIVGTNRFTGLKSFVWSMNGFFFCVIDNGAKKLKEMKDCVSSNNKFELSLLFLAFHKRNSLLMRLNYVPLKSSTKDQL